MIPLLLFRITSGAAPVVTISFVEGDASVQRAAQGAASYQGASGAASQTLGVEGDASKG